MSVTNACSISVGREGRCSALFFLLPLLLLLLLLSSTSLPFSLSLSLSSSLLVLVPLFLSRSRNQLAHAVAPSVPSTTSCCCCCCIGRRSATLPPLLNRCSPLVGGSVCVYVYMYVCCVTTHLYTRHDTTNLVVETKVGESCRR